MEDLYFVIFIAVIGLVPVFVMPWINRARINDLKQTVKLLTYVLEKEGIFIPKTKSIERQIPDKYIKTTIKQKSSVEEITKEFVEPEINVTPKTESQLESVSKVGFEQQFGARFPVWIGGIALALAGFFLVKYSIDNNLLSPAVRVTLGGILGVALLYSAKWVRSKPDFANGVRIAQSLAGAGIAILYVVSFASA